MKSYKKILLVIIFVIASIALLSLPTAQAAKKRVRISAPRGTSYSSAKLSRATNSVVLTFLNLGKVSKITYSLSYTANGIQQGVVGSLVPSGQGTDSRDLYFGTCSKGVCTPHYNIKNGVLLVSTTLASGATNVKRYRLKI